MMREILNRALYYLSVPKCIVCGKILDYGQNALCEKCFSEYNAHKSRNCSRCSKFLHECTCSNFYLESKRVKKLIKVYRYLPKRIDTPSNRLIFSLKHDNRRDTFAFLSEELAASISSALDINGREEQFVITNIPRRPAAKRRDGYDHAKELAKRVAKLLNVKYLNLLSSKAKSAQRETKGEQRRKNARFVYSRKATNLSLKGLTPIIIDDVVTTGSSLAAAADLLRGLGARKIVGAAVSIAYKDSWIKPIEYV